MGREAALGTEADEPDARQTRRRARGRRPETRRPPTVPTDRWLGGELDEETLAAIKKLPPAEQVTLTLAGQRFSPLEIAGMLGVSESAVYMRLYRARKRVRALRKGGSGGGALVAWFAAAPHRLPRLTMRRRGLLPNSATPPSFLTTNMVPLLAAALLTAGPVVMPAAGGVLSPEHAFTATGTPSAVALGAPLIAASTGSSRGSSLPASYGGGAAAARRAEHSITPADTRLMAVTPAPDYVHNHTVVALGESDQCHCFVLFQSTDGAAHWAWTPGPPAGEQVALPPDYPRDPRLFIGNGAGATRSADYVAERFGAPFSALPTPPGLLALSGAFDQGDPRVYVSTATGLMAINMARPTAPAVAVVSSGLWGTASLVSAPDAAGVLALMPPHSADLPAPGEPLSQPASGSAALFGCDGEACSHLTDTGSASAENLVVSVTYASDRLLAAWTSATPSLAVSTDGGRSFQPVVLPARTAAVRSVTLEGGRLWLATFDQGGMVGLYWTQIGTGAWQAVPSPVSHPGAVVTVVALTAGRLLYLVDGYGYRCSTDAGAAWRSACPGS